MSVSDSYRKSAQALAAELEEWGADLAQFARVALRAELSAQQLQICQALDVPGARVAVSSGHGTGKTAVEAWAILRNVLAYPDSRCLVTAPAGPQLHGVLLPEIALWRAKLHPYLRNQVEVVGDEVRARDNPKGRFAALRTARRDQPEALQGTHSEHLLVIAEEASGIEDTIWPVLLGSLTHPANRMLCCANPTRTNGFFWQCFHATRDQWTRLMLSSADSPFGGRAYADAIRAQYGEDSDIYRVRVLGQFPLASVCQLIPRALADGAAGKHLTADQYSHAAVVLGVDVAWQGGDRSCVYLRQGLRSEWLGTWRGIDNMRLADLVAGFEDAHHADAVFIDVGWGTGVIDRLRQLGRKPVPVNFGSAANNAARFANKRAEMWVSCQEWLQSGGILPSRQDLIDDLTGPEYFHTPSAKLMIESKDDMRKRGLASPDEGDALVLTFAANVLPAGRFAGGERRIGGRTRQANGAFDPLARKVA